ncbi:DUF4395 domain-containing protein [Paenibacillus sedimenti]|uniref:DUF4395 domain-containing protein n=1 Tax=Paenibacillus sedimenti TaxID=2770274 RepID=A0A926QL17_9BACL|nr:DUF4395 domain-containing protein [Paenibacillus sedimenti]MBD0383125.1 DUF4395 domain-containing protein [Paenibacillus sedimenti]
MKEVPLAYVKANQTGIVIFVILSFALLQPWLIALLWVIQVVGLLSRGKWNVFVQIFKRFMTVKGSDTQAEELTRFNNTLAVLFLTLSLLSFALGWVAVGYIFAGFLLLAAGAALLGYCIGCTIYYQYKQFVKRH